jgi:hypothetical protein
MNFAPVEEVTKPISMPPPPEPKPQVRKPLFTPKVPEPIAKQLPEEEEDELDIPAFIRKKMK